MKLIKRLFLLLIIAGAIYLGYFIKQQGSGFVLIQYQAFSIETSVFVFSGFILLLFILLYALLRSVFNVFKLPAFINRSYSNYQNKKSTSGLISGLTEFTEGRFKKAESIFIKQASGNENSFLNYLLAARAAQLLHADDRRDTYLKQAHNINPDADIAIGLTQAELQLAHQQNEMALATLSHLMSAYPKHDYIMRLLSRAYLQLEDWSHLCPLLKEMRHSKSIPDELLIKTETVAYSGYLKQAGQQQNSEKLDSLWSDIPKSLRQNSDIIELYAQQLILCGQLQRAEKLLRETLNKKWNEQLITLYASFIHNIRADHHDSYFNSLLDNCEKWLKANPQHATVLLAAGKIAVQLKLWGKAHSFFDSSLSSQPLSDTFLQLALLLEQTNDSEKAQKYYQQGLVHCNQQRSF
ncbi:MAG: hypothetical protein OEY29_10175 [Gammaproteobacteria bacterium]|nr:hypothetical protein [Gammaproteobacteria bacterium]